jgi:hypothetical protein
MTQLACLFAFQLLWFIPLRRILARTQLPEAIAFIALFPVLGPLACAWILAIRPWPIRQRVADSYR